MHNSTSSSGPEHPNLLVRWFVQYNPLFTASALCVLGGVLLLSRTVVDAAGPLTLVLELYQWLVIGTAALLYRRLLDHRPAVILGVIALVFLVDPTLQVAALGQEEGGAAAVACWFFSFVFKVRALVFAFRLRLHGAARVLPVVVAALIAGVPQLRFVLTDDAAQRVVLTCCSFGLGLLLTLGKPRVTSTRALSEYGVAMFARLQGAMLGVLVVGVGYQTLNAALQSGIAVLVPAVVVLPLLLVVTAAKEAEEKLWAAFCFCFAVSAFFRVDAVVMPFACVAFLIASRVHAPRVLMAALVTGYLALTSTFGKQLEVLAVLAALATVPALVVLVKRTAWSALPLLAYVHVSWAIAAGFSTSSIGKAQWGLGLLAVGFVCVPAGVLLQRKLQKLVDAHAAEADAKQALQALEAAPSTSVTVPS